MLEELQNVTIHWIPMIEEMDPYQKYSEYGNRFLNDTPYMVCDEPLKEIRMPYASEEESGRYRGSQVIGDYLVHAYDADFRNFEKNLRPYSDSVIKRLLDDSEHGKQLLQVLIKGTCDLKVEQLAHCETDIYFGEGIYPDYILDRCVKVNDNYLVNVEMQQYINSNKAFRKRVRDQFCTVISAKQKTNDATTIAIWFLVKDIMFKDDTALIHDISFCVKEKDSETPKERFVEDRVYVVEMAKLKDLEEAGKSELERLLQFLLFYGDEKKEALVEELMKEELLMECARRSDTYTYGLKDICMDVKRRYDAMVLEDVKVESKQEGWQEGRKEGKQEGRKETIIEVVLNFYKTGISKNKIAKTLNIDKAFVDAIIKNEPKLRNK